MAGIHDRFITEELKQSYIDYAMSVIVGRALPDIRDGLKPVQRRIVYSMYETGSTYNTPYKKSARIVGDVLGKYHPHGDASVYDALVRMAQDFVMRYPLVDGHGNFGSMDGDPPAAMRYTEVRLTRLAEFLVQDLDKNTVDWIPNFDGTLNEPQVLPAVFPQLLVNGSNGIAVGVSTYIPPHNLTEVIDATLHYIENPESSSRDLMRFVKGPDFPTGGQIINPADLVRVYGEGKGVIRVRGKARLEDGHGQKNKLVIYEIPYMVNKAELVSQIAQLIRDRKLSGVDEVRDESNRQGVRVVLELKKGASFQHILNQLYEQTGLETSYALNMVALKDGAPVQFSLKDYISSFVEFRKETVIRKTKYLLDKATKRREIVEGILKALDSIDLVINIIRNAETTEQAKQDLMAKIGLTEVQAEAVLEIKLRSLVHMEKEKVQQELDALLKAIEEYNEILGSEKKLLEVIAEDLRNVKKLFGNKRRTQIGFSEAQIQGSEEGTEEFYVEMMDLSIVRRSKNVPAGVDYVKVQGSDTVMFLTSFGKIFAISAYEIPESQKGVALNALFPMGNDERVIMIGTEGQEVIALSEKGKGKRFKLDSSKIPTRGGYYFLLDPGDTVVLVVPVAPEIVIVTAQGKAVRLDAESIPERGLRTGGVKVVRIYDGDKIAGATGITTPYVVTMTENAYVKKTPAADIPKRRRGAAGVFIHKANENTGPVIGVSCSNDELLYRAGREWRKLSVKDVRVCSKVSMGKKVLRTTINRLV
ncbi:DNA gyrase/topoisomerase IV subunit A [Coprothermobacter platensis]|uniref:DNA gyrase/topoisomerase IV subunit A n=1 Tax=Coprothermobacter platensis TaxID=108819 RepID=UPI00037DDC7A|nr:DNA topoisomerase (ATP-hydrolyzing) [Coprothermobacter platensis]